MGKFKSHYCNLVSTLAHIHAHKNSPERRFVIQKKMSNPLDYDEVGDLLDDAIENLDFIEESPEGVWLQQNRDLLLFIDEECDDMELEFISTKFSHLTPPSLRDDFDLPPPHH